MQDGVALQRHAHLGHEGTGGTTSRREGISILGGDPTHAVDRACCLHRELGNTGGGKRGEFSLSIMEGAEKKKKGVGWPTLLIKEKKEGDANYSLKEQLSKE